MERGGKASVVEVREVAFFADGCAQVRGRAVADVELADAWVEPHTQGLAYATAAEQRPQERERSHRPAEAESPSERRDVGFSADERELQRQARAAAEQRGEAEARRGMGGAEACCSRAPSGSNFCPTCGSRLG